MDDVSITFARKQNRETIEKLLKDVQLPYEDVADHLQHFLVARIKNRIVGTIGLEPHEENGLLRSLVVVPDCRGKGVGIALYDRIVAYAHLQGTKCLYLLTTTTADYFLRQGFTKIKRELIPQVIQETKECRSLCPATAECMKKDITEEVVYYPREILRLHPDVPGAAMWAVFLSKTMFTYFEIEQNSKFELHHHRSEQITMALEGKLYFEMSNRTVRVRKRDIVAIPSDVPHSVFARDMSVKAVDAWSPVREQFKKV